MLWQTSLSFVSILSPRTCHRSSLPIIFQVLLHSGFEHRSFLTYHVHILEYERRLFESNEVVDVNDAITLLNAQLQQRVVYEILSKRYKITYEFWCICFFHFVYDIILLSISLHSIWIHACLLYWEEWKIIEFTHLIGFRLIFSITCSRWGTPTNS